MKVVLDANVYISALLSKRGVPKQIIDLWREEAFELLISEAILEEVARVLRYPRMAELHKLSQPEQEEFLALLRDEARLIKPKRRLSVSPDETDNRYIECAVDGGAEVLVTGDKRHLLPIKKYEGIAIISPATFLILLQAER
jgi:putative PIN family toxin of toxin-antitoxin system